MNLDKRIYSLKDWMIGQLLLIKRKGWASPWVLAVSLFCLSVFWPIKSNPGDWPAEIYLTLPADIMEVDLGGEIWTYRLFEDGRIEKIVYITQRPDKTV
jgi:hypothetical protein